LRDNGWLRMVDVVFSGYLPSEAHVDVVQGALADCRAATAPQTSPRLVVDPILGDHPKGLYVDEAAARAIATRLIDEADLVTPNAFELAWIANARAGGAAADVTTRPAGSTLSFDEAQALVSQAVPDRVQVLATSISTGDDSLEGAVHFDAVDAAGASAGERQSAQAFQRRRAAVPHGTGDFLAAAFLGWMLGSDGQLLSGDAGLAIARAVGALERLLEDAELDAGLPLQRGGGRWADGAPERSILASRSSGPTATGAS